MRKRQSVINRDICSLLKKIKSIYFILEVKNKYRVSSNLLNKEKLEYPCQVSTEWADFFSEDNTHDNVHIHRWTSIDTHKYSQFFFIHSTN